MIPVYKFSVDHFSVHDIENRGGKKLTFFSFLYFMKNYSQMIDLLNVKWISGILSPSWILKQVRD